MTGGQWRSVNGVVVRDLVPARDRREWVARGWCPGRDVYTLFAEWARRCPRRQAVVDPGGVLGYAELDAAARDLAARLAAGGLGARDVVAVSLPNGRDAVVAELAVAALGALALPYPPGRGSLGAVSLLRRSRARGAVLADPAALPRDRLPDLRTVLTVRGGAGDGGPAAPHGWRPSPVDPEAPARVLVSSGSEAEPKMVAYSHNAMAGGRAAYVRALHDGDGPMRNLVLVPLGSSMGSCGTYVTLAALGGTLLLQDSYDPASALRLLHAHRPTHVWGVPTMLRRLAEAPHPPGERPPAGLRALVSSGAALPEATAAACRERFGCRVVTVYGSADGVNCHTAATGLSPATGTGLPDPAVARIRITDAAGRPVPPGDCGEIEAKGPMTPLCHVAAPELDARNRTPTGWVRTGDLGRLDAHGRLHVLGRLRQVVVRGGYSISPAEVERELAAHPAVAEVACVPVPDAEMGERLCACVRPAAGAGPLTLAGLTAFLEEARGLERRKLPELLLAVDRMPLGPTGKVCRRTLAERAARARTPAAPNAPG